MHAQVLESARKHMRAYLISGTGRDGTIPEKNREPNFRDAGTVTETPTVNLPKIRNHRNSNLPRVRITENLGLWSGVMKTESRGQAFTLG